MSESWKAFLVAMALCLLAACPFLILSISSQAPHPQIAAQKMPTQETTPQSSANASTKDNLLIVSTPDEDSQSWWAKFYLGATAFGLVVAFLGLLASYKTNQYGAKISASQKVQIAEANQRADEARLRIVKLTTQRVITPEAVSRFLEIVASAPKGLVFVDAGFADPEARGYAEGIRGLLRRAGYESPGRENEAG